MSNFKNLADRIEDVVDILLGIANDLENVPEPEVPSAPDWPPFDPESEEAVVGMLTWGNPLLAQNNPVGYARAIKYADPFKPPFTQTSWMTSGWSGKDVRMPLQEPRNVEAEIAEWIEQHRP